MFLTNSLIFHHWRLFNIFFYTFSFSDFARGILQDGGPNPRQGKKTDNAHPPIHPLRHADNLQVKAICRLYCFSIHIKSKKIIIKEIATIVASSQVVYSHGE